MTDDNEIETVEVVSLCNHEDPARGIRISRGATVHLPVDVAEEFIEIGRVKEATVPKPRKKAAAKRTTTS